MKQEEDFPTTKNFLQTLGKSVMKNGFVIVLLGEICFVYNIFVFWIIFPLLESSTNSFEHGFFNVDYFFKDEEINFEHLKGWLYLVFFHFNFILFLISFYLTATTDPGYIDNDYKEVFGLLPLELLIKKEECLKNANKAKSLDTSIASYLNDTYYSKVDVSKLKKEESKEEGKRGAVEKINENQNQEKQLSSQQAKLKTNNVLAEPPSLKLRSSISNRVSSQEYQRRRKISENLIESIKRLKEGKKAVSSDTIQVYDNLRQSCSDEVGSEIMGYSYEESAVKSTSFNESKSYLNNAQSIASIIPIIPERKNEAENDSGGEDATTKLKIYIDGRENENTKENEVLIKSPSNDNREAEFNQKAKLKENFHSKSNLSPYISFKQPESQISNCKDRNLSQAETKYNNLKMYEKKDNLIRICKFCLILKPDRTHHCRLCHRCVRKLDHHCVFVNNCIGYKNYKYFISFIFYGFVSVSFLSIVMLKYLNFMYEIYGISSINLLMYTIALTTCLVFCLMLGGLLCTHIWLIFNNLSYSEYMDNKKTNVARIYEKNYFNISLGFNVREALGENWILWFFPINNINNSISKNGYEFKAKESNESGEKIVATMTTF